MSGWVRVCEIAIKGPQGKDEMFACNSQRFARSMLLGSSRHDLFLYTLAGNE